MFYEVLFQPKGQKGFPSFQFDSFLTVVTRKARRMWNNLFCHSDLCSLTWLKATWQPSSCLSGVTRATLLPGSLTLKVPSTSKDTLHYSLNRLSGEPNYPWTPAAPTPPPHHHLHGLQKIPATPQENVHNL